MSGPILFGENVVRLPSPRIAREDVASLKSAADLLEEARRIRDETQAASDTARANGFEAGMAEARARTAEALSAALATLAGQFGKENARREGEVAAAAMHVIEQLIGQRDPADVVAGLARQALRKVDAGSAPCVLEVAPDMAQPMTEQLAETHPALRIEPSAALDTLSCRIVSGEGRIIADLETQLATLRGRWGIDADEGAA